MRRIIPTLRPSDIGESVENLGLTAMKAQQAMQAKDAAVYVGKNIAQARVAAEQTFLDTQGKSSDDIQKDGGFTPSVMKGFTAATQAMTDEAPNGIAKRLMQEHLQSLGADLQIRALKQDAANRVVEKATSATTSAKTAATAVELNPDSWQAAGGEQHASIANMGLPPEETTRLQSLSNEMITRAAAKGYATQDPVTTLKRLHDAKDPLFSSMSLQERESTQQQANDSAGKPIYDSLTNEDFKGAQSNLDRVKSVMDPHKVYELQNTIDAKIKEKQNENKQDIADRFQDSMVSAQYGLKNPVSVTRAEMDVLYPKDGQRHWDALQSVVASGAKAQEYDRMTPEQIQADVNSSRPTTGGPEAALRIKAFEIRANAAEQSMKARTQDPAQFAIDSGAGWKPLDLSKPEDAMAQLKSRANSQGLVSEQTGVNTPLLTKQETHQLTGWLDNQKPSDRLQTLTSLRTSLPNDQAYGSLMKQIAPDSPITAVAGAMLDKPPVAAPAWYDSKFTTNPIVPQRMLEGQDILRAKDEKGITSKFPMPSDEDLQSQFQSAVGGANSDLFRGRPQTLETAFAAYKAYYAAEASHRGVTNGVINTDIAQLAAQSVVGHATTYGSTTLTVPAGMDPTRFEGTVTAASKSALLAGGYSAKDIEALRGYGLRELGDTLGTGRYVIIDGNGDPLKSKTGQNSVIIDLNKVRSQHASVFKDTEEAGPTPTFPGNMGK